MTGKFEIIQKRSEDKRRMVIVPLRNRNSNEILGYVPPYWVVKMVITSGDYSTKRLRCCNWRVV